MDSCKNFFIRNLRFISGLGQDTKSRKVFTHIESLGGKKIKHIYAGGNHSWALLDYDNPFTDYF